MARFRSSHSEVFYKKDVLKNAVKFTGKNLSKFTGKHLLFNKFACWMPAISSHRLQHRCFALNFSLKETYFINVSNRLLLRSDIFVVVSFRKALGFCIKQNRQLFYYERTVSCVSLKIPERLNKVVFQNFFEWLLLKIL